MDSIIQIDQLTHFSHVCIRFHISEGRLFKIYGRWLAFFKNILIFGFIFIFDYLFTHRLAFILLRMQPHMFIDSEDDPVLFGP